MTAPAEAALRVIDEALRVASVKFAKAATTAARKDRDRIVERNEAAVMRAWKRYVDGFVRRNLGSAVTKAIRPRYPARGSHLFEVDWDRENEHLERELGPVLRPLAEGGFASASKDMGRKGLLRGRLDLETRNTVLIRDRLATRIRRINQSNREIVRRQIEHGLREGWSQRELILGRDGEPGLRDTVRSWGSPDKRAKVIALTESANAFNLGSLVGYQQAGIVTEVVIYDGEGTPEDPEWCGWTEHDDPDKASGSIRTLDEANDYPTSHPNCQRSWAPVAIPPLRDFGPPNWGITEGEEQDAEDVDIAARAPVVKFDPDQPRDASGKWTAGGGSEQEPDYDKILADLTPSQPERSIHWPTPVESEAVVNAAERVLRDRDVEAHLVGVLDPVGIANHVSGLMDRFPLAGQGLYAFSTGIPGGLDPLSPVDNPEGDEPGKAFVDGSGTAAATADVSTAGMPADADIMRPGRAFVELNADIYGSQEAFDRFVSTSPGGTRWFADPTREGVLTHEFGHVYLAALARHAPDDMAVLLDTVWQGAVDRWTAGEVGDDTPSGYAEAALHQNMGEGAHHEFLAEAFVEATSGRDDISTWGAEFRRLLDEGHIRKFDPDQPRDSGGRWTSGGDISIGISPREAPTAPPPVTAPPERIFDVPLEEESGFANPHEETLSQHYAIQAELDGPDPHGANGNATAISPGHQQVIVDTIAELRRDFPLGSKVGGSQWGQATNLVYIESVLPSSGADAIKSTSFADAATKEGDATVRLNALYWGDPGYLEVSLAEAEKSGHLVDGTPRGVINHEYAHTMMQTAFVAVLADRLGMETGKNGYTTVRSSFNLDKENGILPSRYANANQNELWAEAFAEARTDKPTADISPVGQVTRQYLADPDGTLDRLSKGKTGIAAFDTPVRKDWNEEDHPRDERGRFTSGGGATSSGADAGGGAPSGPPDDQPGRTQGPPSVERAERTMEALIRPRTGSQYAFEGVELHGIEPRYADEMAETLTALHQRFPDTVEAIRSIRLGDTIEGAEAQQQATRQMAPSGSDITFNRASYEDADLLEQARIEDRQVGWSADASVRGTLNHEFGHALVYAEPDKAETWLREFIPAAQAGRFEFPSGYAIAAMQQDPQMGIHEVFGEAFAEALSGKGRDEMTDSGRWTYDWLERNWPSVQKWDPDQPRDEQGRWTSTGGGGGEWRDPGGSRPGYEDMPSNFDSLTNEEQTAYYDQRRAAERAWDHAMNIGVATGRVSVTEAAQRGWYPAGLRGGIEAIVPLPERLYHATGAIDAVLEQGLKSRAEVREAGGTIGLGGGDDETISFTTDPAIAERIAEVMVEAHRVATGDITFDDLRERAIAGGFYEKAVEVANGPKAVDTQLVRGMMPERVGLLRSEAEMREEEGDRGWVMAPDAVVIVGGDGERRTNSWERPMTDTERRQATLDFYRGPFNLAQEVNGGPMDPLIWGGDVENFAAIDPDKVGVVEATAKPGAVGFQTAGLGEWRTWSGDTVTLRNITKFDPDQPRDEQGRWALSGPSGHETTATTHEPHHEGWQPPHFGSQGGYMNGEVVARRITDEGRALVAEMQGRTVIPSPPNVSAERVVGGVINRIGGTWSRTGLDDDRAAAMLQHAVATEFGIDDSPMRDRAIYAEMAEGAVPGSAAEAELAITRVAVRAMYDEAQAMLKERGIERLTLWRGEPGEAYEGPTGRVTAEMNALSAWSTTPRTAAAFAGQVGFGETGGYGTVYRIDIPAERVFGFEGTGIGQSEGVNEVVILGGDIDAVAFQTAHGVIIGKDAFDEDGALPKPDVRPERAPVRDAFATLGKAKPPRIRVDRPGTEDWLKQVRKHGDHDQSSHGNWATGGTEVGVSRDRPSLGGGQRKTYAEVVAGRRVPAIAEAERTTTPDLERLGIPVEEQRQVAGYFEGGGEPSLMVELGPGHTTDDIDLTGAYLVRRNEQDSVIANITGSEMRRLGLTPNGDVYRVTGLPTDEASRAAIFERLQSSKVEFASYDEEHGIIEASAFDADQTEAFQNAMADFAITAGGELDIIPAHTRWYFHDEDVRTGAASYLNPIDPGVLITADEVRASHPRGGAIGGHRVRKVDGRGAPQGARSGPATGGEGARQRDGARPQQEAVGKFSEDQPREYLRREWHIGKFDPDQPRDESGRWTSTGGAGALASSGVSARPPVGTSIPDNGRAPKPSVPAGALPVGTGVNSDGMGHIGLHMGLTSDVERVYGQTIRGDEVISPQDPRIPEEVYHVTSNISAVVDSGYLRAAGEGGLGGDANDRIVSMTVDRETAEQLADDLKTASAIDRLNGPEALAFLDRKTEEDGWGERWVQSTMTGYGELAGQRWPGEGYSGHDWATHYFIARENALGLQNPVFFGSQAGIDPEQVGVVAIPKANLDNGALLVDFDLRRGENGLREVRSYGDVPLGGGRVIKHGDHDQSSHGNWATGYQKPEGAEASWTERGQLEAPDHINEFNEAAQRKIQSHIEFITSKVPEFPDTPYAMSRIVLDVYEGATPEQVAAGMVWYQEAHDAIKASADDTGTPLDRAVAMTAVLSPTRNWGDNIELADRVMLVSSEDKPFEVTQEQWDRQMAFEAEHPDKAKSEGMDGPGEYKPSDLTPAQVAIFHPTLIYRDVEAQTGGFGSIDNIRQLTSAVEIWRGEKTPDEALTGPKTRNFYNNMRDPDDPFSVTIDAIQAMAQTPDGLELPLGGAKSTRTANSDDYKEMGNFIRSGPVDNANGLGEASAVYSFYATATQIAAAEKGILPQQMQAITWLATPRDLSGPVVGGGRTGTGAAL